MNFRTLFFVMLYVNGVLCGWLFEAWREQSICAAPAPFVRGGQ